MPFINRSTLTYPVTNAFPNGIWEDTRDPTTADYKNFQIGVTWINTANQTVWFMVDRSATDGTWVQGASAGTGILDVTGDSGGAVGPDGANNINLIGSDFLAVSGNPGTNTLTITQDGTVATSYVEDAGSATPAAGVINIVGTAGISTSGAGSTVTITAGGIIPTTFTEDGGSAAPAANNLNILGGTGITTSGAGSTVTISTTGAVATSYAEDVGSAVPAANTLNIVGSGGITTSGAGSTVTITAGATIPTTFTEDAGSATPAANNLNIVGAGGITTSGAGSTVTVTAGATIPTTFTEDAGSATPAANNLNIVGGTGISTSGAGSTVTVAAAGSVATSYVEDAGSAIPAANIINIVGGTGISTSGAGNTVTITNTSTSSTTFTEDAGSATPAAGILNILGGSGISTSGAGNTVTIAKSTQSGFFAYLNTGVTNKTGDGTNYTVLFDTVLFDNLSDYNSGTGLFTAPTTGTYVFSCAVGFENLNASHINGSLSFQLSTGFFIEGNAGSPIAQGPGTKVNWVVSTIIRLTAGQTIKVVGRVAGGTKTVGLEGTASFPGIYACFFSGALI